MKEHIGRIAIAVALVMCAIIIALAFRYTPVSSRIFDNDGHTTMELIQSFDRWRGAVGGRPLR